MMVIFPGVQLEPSLYYQWDTSIHFALGEDISPWESGMARLNPRYFHLVYQQTNTLFDALFDKDDSIWLVTNNYKPKRAKRQTAKKMKVYQPHIKTKHILQRLQQRTIAYPFDEDDSADWETNQFVLQCRKQDIAYQGLIKAICNQDFPRNKPAVYNPYGSYAPDVFFINAAKHVIYYIYDDRGCEVIAKDKETIRPIYHKYKDWIDDYNRPEVDEHFS
ncbi:hypothetical protein Pryu01_01993 [Paraliobacillus ryukyuensis]|uniref:Uncharacterized protein DUF3885 n=1 Tax=Paraliobacillus ryukyuensis TaxID=200904 RepID=A0A366DYT0_9BACI|nr:DUF3885 domain-containing protein [Paraliobacillus ryukyuensis]RBO95260.1 uncharacterized protein DUF3885 [Paraliobacillus ryukyuensis]